MQFLRVEGQHFLHTRATAQHFFQNFANHKQSFFLNLALPSADQAIFGSGGVDAFVEVNDEGFFQITAQSVQVLGEDFVFLS